MSVKYCCLTAPWPSALERSGNNVSNAIARDHIAKHHPTELTYDDDVEAFKHVKATAVPPVIVHAGSGGATTLATGLQSMSALMS